jgi:hypothetical protein
MGDKGSPVVKVPPFAMQKNLPNLLVLGFIVSDNCKKS